MPDEVIELQFQPLHYAQQLIFDHPARFKVLACGRRFGKTTLAKRALYEGIIAGDKPYAFFAPTNKMMSEVWRAVKADLAPVITYTSEKERFLQFLTGASIDFWSLDSPDGPRGRAYAGIVVDEAALIRDQGTWTEVLRPLLTDYEGWAFFLSTPKGRNWFYHLFVRGRDGGEGDWQSWRFPTVANPELPPGEVDAAKKDLPELSFDQEYLAKFLEDSSSVFRGVGEVCTGVPESQPVEGHSHVIGVDWGRKDDYTVLAVLDEQTKSQVHVDRFREINWQMQRGRLKALADKFHPRVIIAEENAMGEPVIEALIDDGLPVKPFYTSVSSKGPLIDALALAIERQDITLLDDPVLRDEFHAYEMLRLPSGAWKFSAPPGAHDDIVMATALMWYAYQSKPAVVQMAANPFYN